MDMPRGGTSSGTGLTLALCLFLGIWVAPPPPCLSGQASGYQAAGVSDDNRQMLSILYKEAFQASPQVTMDYVKNEFHVDLDGRSANKEEHVVFLCYGCPEGTRFVVQVTYFQLVGHDVLVKYADETRQILCTVTNELITVDQSDYTDGEMKRLLKTLIRRVEEENELLRLAPVKK
jgi:hypothetical protein